MPDQPDQQPVPPAAAPPPEPAAPDAPRQAAERARYEHGGFSDTNGESTITDMPEDQAE